MKERGIFKLLGLGVVVAILAIGTPLCAQETNNVDTGGAVKTDTENSGAAAADEATTDTATTATATAKPADNTGRNVRDRDDQTLTPMDQGNTKADLEITRQIRKGINADKTLSTTAKNVKIITIDGKVTLRGPVKSAEEKQLIGDIAEKAAKGKGVDNQLEIANENK